MPVSAADVPPDIDIPGAVRAGNLLDSSSVFAAMVNDTVASNAIVNEFHTRDPSPLNVATVGSPGVSIPSVLSNGVTAAESYTAADGNDFAGENNDSN